MLAHFMNFLRGGMARAGLGVVLPIRLDPRKAAGYAANLGGEIDDRRRR